MDIYFISLGQTASSGTAGGSYDRYIFNCKKTLKLPKWLIHFTFPLTMCKSCVCSRSLPTLGIVSLFNLSPSNGMVLTHDVFHLDFLDGYDGEHIFICFSSFLYLIL